MTGVVWRGDSGLAGEESWAIAENVSLQVIVSESEAVGVTKKKFKRCIDLRGEVGRFSALFS